MPKKKVQNLLQRQIEGDRRQREYNLGLKVNPEDPKDSHRRREAEKLQNVRNREQRLAESHVLPIYIEAENEFVTSEKPVTISELSRKHGVTLDKLIKHSRKEGWLQKRYDFWSDVREEMQELTYKTVVERRVHRLNAVAEVADELIEELRSEDKISRMTVQDLLKLLEIEKTLLNEIPVKQEEGTTTVSEIMQMQITRLRTAMVRRDGNVQNVVNQGLQRLGITEVAENGSTSSDGGDEEGQDG